MGFFSRLFGAGSPSATDHLDRGLACLDNDQPEGALAEFTEAIRLDPQCAEAYYCRGVLGAEQDASERALDDFNAAIQIEAKWEYLFDRGRLHADAGRFPEAVADFSAALGSNPSPDEAALGDLYYWRGYAAGELEQYDLAIADLTLVIGLDPDHDQACLRRGHAYFERQQYDLAIADLTEVLRADPEELLAYRIRAAAYSRCGRHAEAAADLAEVIRREPESAAPYLSRAAAYRALGEEAKAALDERMAQTLQAVTTCLEQGFVALQQRDWDRSIALLTEAIRLDPAADRAYLRRAMACLGKDRADLAIADCTHVIQHIPSPLPDDDRFLAACSDAYATRGNAYAHQGDLQHAIADFSEAIRLTPGIAPIYLFRAAAYQAAGDMERAAGDHRKASELAE